MNTKVVKRFFSYVIDIEIISIIMRLINMYVISENELALINDNFNKINEMILQKNIDFNSYIYNFATIIHDITNIYMISIIINMILCFIYFVVIPYKSKGITLGQLIFGLRTISLEDEELSFRQLIKRSLILYGIIFNIFVLITIYILPVKAYFIIVSFLGIVQFLLVIISGFMILYKKDKRGLHDIIANTAVVDKNNGVIE